MKKILLVDDDADLRSMLRVLLEDQGHEVVEAANGMEGTRQAQDSNPDLILLDVDMPVVDGFTVCKVLKGTPATASIPVLMLTTRSDRGSIELGLFAGADDYAVKPIQLRDLTQRVTTLLKAGALSSLATSDDRQARDLTSLLGQPTNLAVLFGGVGAMHAIPKLVASLSRPPACPVVAMLQIPAFALRYHAAQFTAGGKLAFEAAAVNSVLKPGHCYLVPDAGPLLIVGRLGRRLTIVQQTQEAAAPAPIDDLDSADSTEPKESDDAPNRVGTLLASAAVATGGAALVMVLSGGVDPGCLAGLDALKARGAEIYVQEEGSAALSDLPRQVMGLGVVDGGLSPGEMGIVLSR